jgi:hypothetical protein
MIAVGDPLPKLASVEPANGPTSISVAWALGSRAGISEIIDLAPMIYTFKILRPLRDNPELFRTVRLGDWGASIVWEGHPDLDIGADALEELASEQMSPQDFQAFMKRHGFSYDATAAALGISRRLVAYYAKERMIPRTVALACKYIDISHVGEKQLLQSPDIPASGVQRLAASSGNVGVLSEVLLAEAKRFTTASLSHISSAAAASLYWKTATSPETVKGPSAKPAAAKPRRTK